MAPRFKACSVDGCNGNAARAAEGRRGFCDSHYRRNRAHGDPLGGRLPAYHGMSKTRLYHIWNGMLLRCGHRPGCHDRDGRNYRDRGVRACDAWMQFHVFAAWATANGYAGNLTIDRVDSDRGYEPDNCRWVTLRDNLRAKRGLKLSMDDAREIRRLRAARVPIADLAERYHVAKSFISAITTGAKWPE